MAAAPEPDPSLEHELGRLLNASVQDLHPPVAVMLAEATRRGRALHRRRRLRTAGSAVAVLALAAGLALTGLPGRTGGGGGGPVTAAPAGPTADQVRQRQHAALQATLARLLGPGIRLSAEAGADQLSLDPAADAVLWMRYDDGSGAGTVSVEVHGPASQATAPSCDGRGETDGASGYHCTAAAYGPSGLPQVVEVLRTAATGWLSYRIWTAHPDGTRVALAVHNGTLHESDDPQLSPRLTRAEPPFALGRWQQIAADDGWPALTGLAGGR
ncbi:hypothetical protein [Kitasatospora sp. NPDC058218]|uniref:hypothetical protein n=1 Tax=Kitasatospora sp. NPDC058218 TaxID=3346385 RepID=UPI0036DC21FA